MTRARRDAPAPELLAAYLDGELDGCPDRRELVERWLASNPDAAAELSALQRLRELWQQTSPAEPGENAWDALARRLRERLDRQPIATRPATAWQVLPWAAGTAAAAALLWLTWTVYRPGPLPVGPADGGPPPLAQVEPYPVATEDEVQILQVDGRDKDAVVGAALPVELPLVLAGPDDVTVKSIEPAPSDQMVPGMVDGPAPMIWADLAEQVRRPQ